ncbi:MAG: TIR domain-containing protein [ANME-2 cluster archaeon]|nr:TIR domain-containing protein [ANME-2 cluster archaeon]
MMDEIHKSTSPLRIFLCHSSGDKPEVRNLYQRLSSDGFDPWLDEEKLLPGQEWQLEIAKAVQTSDVVIVCLSHKAINKAGYVHKEIKDALDKAEEQPEGTIFLIPLKLEECDVPERLQRWHWVNLFEEKGYERLMRSLRLRAEKITSGSNPKTNVIQRPEEVQDPPQNGKCVKFICTSREAEHAKEVYVAGEFNNWLRPKGSLIRPTQKYQKKYGLQKQISEGKEIWEKDIFVSLGHYDFKFVVGKRHWIHWYEESGYTRGNDAPGGPNFRIEVSDTQQKQKNLKKIPKPKKLFKYDVFICHASEDKESFVRALAVKLQDRGLKVWFDESTITLGDSLSRLIDNGLVNSRYGVVVLSKKFFEKEWPQKELDALVAREEGLNKVILPIWHGITQQEVRFFSPILADRLAVSSDKGIDHVANEIVRVKNST